MTGSREGSPKVPSDQWHACRTSATSSLIPKVCSSATITGSDAIDVFAQSVGQSAPFQNRRPRPKMPKLHSPQRALPSHCSAFDGMGSKLRRGRGDRENQTMMELHTATLVRPQSLASEMSRHSDMVW